MPNSLSNNVVSEVTYITPDGALKVRTVNTLPSTIVDCARTLKARYLVAAFDWSVASSCPIWGVYDTHKVTSGGVRGEPSLPLPAKEFTSESNDAAVMYALTLQGGS